MIFWPFPAGDTDFDETMRLERKRQQLQRELSRLEAEDDLDRPAGGVEKPVSNSPPPPRVSAAKWMPGSVLAVCSIDWPLELCAVNLPCAVWSFRKWSKYEKVSLLFLCLSAGAFSVAEVLT